MDYITFHNFVTMNTNMNKSFIIGLLLVCAAGSASAQLQVAVGVKGGANFSSLDVKSSPAANYDARTGFHGGAFALFKVLKFGVQPEVLFSRQGSKLGINGLSLEQNIDYINVPVMLKLYTIAGINLQMGPQLGFLYEASGSVLDNVTQQPIAATKDLYKKSDLSLAFGAGWDLPFGLMVEARYNLGLGAIQDNPDLNSTKNQVFQVSVGYKLLKFGN